MPTKNNEKTTKTKKQYAIIQRPGFFRDVTKVSSCHSTEKLAITKMRTQMYTDECGRVRYPACVVFHESGWTKGETVYSDLYPDIVA